MRLKKEVLASVVAWLLILLALPLCLADPVKITGRDSKCYTSHCELTAELDIPAAYEDGIIRMIGDYGRRKSFTLNKTKGNTYKLTMIVQNDIFQNDPWKWGAYYMNRGGHQWGFLDPYVYSTLYTLTNASDSTELLDLDADNSRYSPFEDRYAGQPTVSGDDFQLNWSYLNYTANVTGAWDFTNNSNTTDLSGEGNDLICINCPISYPAGARFDGSDDYFFATIPNILWQDYMIDYWSFNDIWEYKTVLYDNSTNTYTKHINGVTAGHEADYNISTTRINIGRNDTDYTGKTIANFRITTYGEAGELPSSHSLSDSVIGYWRLNKNWSNGSMIRDFSGYGNNGQDNSKVPFVDGVKNLNNASSFNGKVNQAYLTMGNASVLELNDFWASIWVQPKSFTNAGDLLTVQLQASGLGGGKYSGWYIYRAAGGTLRFSVSTVGSFEPAEYTDETLILNKYNHVVVVKYGTNGKIYLNGELIHEQTMPANVIYTDPTRRTVIGAAWKLFGADYIVNHNGSIDEVIIGNNTDGSFSPSDVKLLYERGFAGIPDNITAYINRTFEKQKRGFNITNVEINSSVNITVARANTTTYNCTPTIKVSVDNGTTWTIMNPYPTWNYFPSGGTTIKYEVVGNESCLLDEFNIENYYGKIAVVTLSPLDGYENTADHNLSINMTFNTSALWVNYSIFEYNNQTGATTKINYSALPGVNETYIEYNHTVSSNGYYAYWAAGENIDNVRGVSGNSTVLFNRYNPPDVTLIYPANASNNNDQEINFTANATDELGIDTCLFYSDMNGSWLVDEVHVIGNYSFNFTSEPYNPIRGTYVWNLICNDTRGDWSVNSNFTFTRTDPPTRYEMCPFSTTTDPYTLKMYKLPCTYFSDISKSCSNYTYDLWYLDDATNTTDYLRYIDNDMYYLTLQNLTEGNYYLKLCDNSTLTFLLDMSLFSRTWVLQNFGLGVV